MRNTEALVLFVFLFLSCSMRQEANITGMCEKDSMSADGIIRLSMGHRTKRIMERGDEKHRKTFIYKELRGLRM